MHPYACYFMLKVFVYVCIVKNEIKVLQMGKQSFRTCTGNVYNYYQ